MPSGREPHMIGEKGDDIGRPGAPAIAKKRNPHIHAHLNENGTYTFTTDLQGGVGDKLHTTFDKEGNEV